MSQSYVSQVLWLNKAKTLLHPQREIGNSFITRLMQLYNETMTQKGPGYPFAALHILKEVAKLKGIYPSRNEFKRNEEVHITLNLGDDLKTGKPEKIHELNL